MLYTINLNSTISGMTATLDQLPHSERLHKLEEFTPLILVMLEMELPKNERFYYGVPLYRSFAMSRREAEKHGKSELLLTKGCDLKFQI